MVTNAYHPKNQSGLEYFSTYGWAVLLIAILGIVIFAYSNTYYNIIPSACSMQGGATCSDVVIGVNSITGKVIASIVFVNKEQYPLTKPEIFFNINGTNTTAAACQPGFVLPGGAIICTATISASKLTNEFVAGNIYLNATDCGTISNPYNAVMCEADGAQATFVGSVQGHITQFVSSPFDIVIVPGNTTQYDTGGKDPLYAKVLFYGRPLIGGTVQLRAYYQSNGIDAVPPYVLATSVAATNDSGIALSYIWGYTPGSIVVNATFGNVSSITLINFVSPPAVSTSTSTTTSSTTTFISTTSTTSSTTTILACQYGTVNYTVTDDCLFPPSVCQNIPVTVVCCAGEPLIHTGQGTTSCIIANRLDIAGCYYYGCGPIEYYNITTSCNKIGCNPGSISGSGCTLKSTGSGSLIMNTYECVAGSNTTYYVSGPSGCGQGEGQGTFLTGASGPNVLCTTNSSTDTMTCSGLIHNLNSTESYSSSWVLESCPA